MLIATLGGCCGNDDEANNEVYSIRIGQKFYPSILKNDIDIKTIDETDVYTKYKIQHRSICIPSRSRYICRRNADSVIVSIYTE